MSTINEIKWSEVKKGDIVMFPASGRISKVSETPVYKEPTKVRDYVHLFVRFVEFPEIEGSNSRGGVAAVKPDSITTIYTN
jgi:hypothetical protein